MKFETVTIKDIAKALALSTSTVSRALRDSHEISDATKKIVLAYAEKVNYNPNPVAQSLKERRSKSIGVVVVEIANSFLSQVINGIESVAYEHGYHVVIAQTHESYERELKALKYLASRSVDGILISLSSETEHMEHLTSMHDMGMPFVFFDRVTDKINTFNITTDNFKGSYDAVMHLINNGFSKIAFMGSATHLSTNKERLAGYEAALKDAGIPLMPEYVRSCYHGGLIYQEVEDEMKRLLKLKAKPDALIAGADKITTNVFRYCKANGVKIPNQLALIGFSNQDLTEYLDPSLSIIRQLAYEMGENAAALMIELLESKRPIFHFDARVLPPQLYVRDSSAKR